METIDEYLYQLQELKNTSGDKVPSPGKILRDYVGSVNRNYRELVRRNCAKIRLTDRQKQRYDYCKKFVYLSLNLNPPKCPDYEKLKDKIKCDDYIQNQHRNFQNKRTEYLKKASELKRSLGLSREDGDGDN